MRTAIASALAAVLMSTSALADVSCWLEASAAKNITSTKVTDGIAGTITVTADGLQGGLGLGCDYLLGSGFKVGILGRYDRPDLKTDFLADTITGSGIYMAGGRVGYLINPGVETYGLLGYSWTDISYGVDLKTKPSGMTYGAGLEINISNLLPHTSIIVEYARTNWDSTTIDATKLSPTSDTIRVGVHYVLDFGGK